MSVLAVIPAKLNSRRVAGKNTRDLGGKPLIQWTIEAAQDAQLVDRVVLATDDAEVGMLAKDSCDVLYRPRELSVDTVNAVAVVLWALEQETADLVVMLQPTSPFRTYRQIDAAIELYNSKPVVSMKKLHGRIYESGRTADLMCQQYTGWLKSNGAIYVDAPDALRARGQFHASSVTPYIMDSLTSLEIDEELDWLLAVSIVEKAADAMEAVLESARKGCGQCAQKKMDG